MPHKEHRILYPLFTLLTKALCLTFLLCEVPPPQQFLPIGTVSSLELKVTCSLTLALLASPPHTYPGPVTSKLLGSFEKPDGNTEAQAGRQGFLPASPSLTAGLPPNLPRSLSPLCDQRAHRPGLAVRVVS